MQKLLQEREKPEYWKQKEKVAEHEQKISVLQHEIESLEKLKEELGFIDELLSQAKEDSLLQEIEQQLKIAKKKLREIKLRKLLGAPEDKESALLELYAGAGGRDAQDWTAMLQRMYLRWANRKGFKTRVLDQSFGEPGGPEGRAGIKYTAIEVRGPYAFGLLKKEAGVHRLVRISPFSPQKLRHTSFCQVTVTPLFQKEIEIKIKPEDLKIETFRASGPGGQYVNKTESAVRITHLPTGIVVSCQAERNQLANRKRALQLLKAKLYKLEKEKQEQRIKQIKGEIDPAWGKQIRSYVLHPYQLVKDLRTGHETSNVKEVLDGELDDFIEKELLLKDAKNS